MVERRPLVLIDGELSELPVTDTLPGGGATGNTPHRHWRLRFIKGQSTTNAAITELFLNGIAHTGVASARTVLSASYPASGAFDNNLNTLWVSSGAPGGEWIALDLGAGNELDVSSVDIHSRISGTLYEPLEFAIEWSDDGTTWTVAWEAVTPTWTNNVRRTFTKPTLSEWEKLGGKPEAATALPNSMGAGGQVLKVAGTQLVWADALEGPIGAHKYWRLDAHAGYGGPVSGYDISVFTLQFRKAGVAHDQTGGVAFGTITNPGNAFDASNTSQATGTWAGNGTPIKVGYQFASAVEVDDVRIGTYFPSVWGPATPALFDILFSDDGVNFTKVVTIDDRGNTVLDYKAFPVPTTTAEPVDATTVKGVAPSGFALTLLDDADAAAARTTLAAPDIEKGTFTPVVIGDTTPGAATYTFQWGDYTRIGDIVHVSLRVNWSGHTGTGSMRISGLPFVSRGHRNAFSLWPDAINMSNANQYPSALMWRTDSYIQIYGVPLGGPDAEATLLPLPASGNIIISGSYHV